MKMFKKLVSVVCAATVLTSSLAFTTSAFSAATVSGEQVAADANLQANVQDGVILHAFNWSYNSIKENLPAIAAAGYSTVQTSPVQQPKDYSLSKDVGGQWWKLYQPVSMQVAQDSWLGTKDDLKSLCAEADKYGIKIICDIVSNHFGNEEMGGANALSTQVKTYQPDFYSNSSAYFRKNSINADSDADTQKIVQGHVSGCPDLNTGNTDVQNAVISYLKDLIDCGVDGFRFDAAKHIETPDDGAYASQYWPNVSGAAKDYYSQKNGGKSLYIYGEILNTPGNSRSFSSYTKYINVTDSATGDNITAAVKNGNVSGAARKNYSSTLKANQVVLWAESHDTYEGSSGNTSSIPDDQIIKSWAMVASRQDATALYFVRPGTALMGEAGTDTSYKSTAVSEINKFHNLFVGQSEKVSYSGGISYVQRGGKGIVLANITGDATAVEIADTGLEDGTYTDTVAGGTFTVSGGTLSGNIGATGVAVVYDGDPTPRATGSVESGTFKGDTLIVKLSLENAVSGTYCLDGSTPVAFTDGTAIKIGSDYEYGETIHLTLAARDAKGNTETLTYNYKKEEDTSSNIYIWFDKKSSKGKYWKTPLNCYMYDEDTVAGTVYCNAASWPGEGMTYDEGQDMWYYKVPTTSFVNGEASDFDLTKSKNAYFIVSGSGNNQQYPASGAHSPKLNAQSWEYTGGTKFVATTRVPTPVVVPATEVTKGKAEEPTTAAPTTVAPTTQKPTQKPTTPQPTDPQPSFPPGNYLFGDVNFDGIVDIEDATLVQLHSAVNESDKRSLKGLALFLADVNNDGLVDITDATYIQLYANDSQKDLKRTGTPYVVPVPTTAAPTTEKSSTAAPTTQAPTTAKPTQAPTTAAPTTAAPTTQEPTVGKSLSVTAASNIAPQATTTFNPVANQITVTWWLNIPTARMINTQFTVEYDKSILEYDTDPGVNQVYDEDDPYTVVQPLVLRATNGDGTVINTEPESMPGGGIKGNASRTSGYKMSKNGGRVPFVSVTFKPKEGVEGKTTVRLNVEIMQIGSNVDDAFYLINNSRIIRPDVSYLPSDTAVAVYAGPFNPDAQQDPDAEQPTTQYVTEEPTLGNPLTVTAKSNVFPQATTTFNAGTKRITVTYWVNISPDRLINTQFKLTYDKSKLEYDEAPGVNQVYDEDDPSEISKYLVLRLTNGRDTVINTNPTGIQGGGIRGNASISDGIKATDNGNRKAFVSVTFKPKEGAEGTTVVNLDVEILQLGNGNPDADYYVVNNSQIVRPDVSILPTDTATAVYEGMFDNSIQQAPDVVPTTAEPTTEAPTTEEPTTVAPTTEEPTTEEPTTVAPTTVAPTTVAPTTVAPTTEAPTDPPLPPKTFKFTDNQGWGTVYVHAWTAERDLTSFPGNQMLDSYLNDMNETVFVITVPGEAAGVVLSNGAGDQTVDISNFDVEGYYTKGDRDGDGHLYVTPWPGGGITGTSFKFTDNQGWGTVYVHAWNESGDLTTFPGNQMTDKTTNDMGETVFTVYVPDGATGVVLSNGSGDQTVDIKNFKVEGYYTTGARDGEGHLYVTYWPGSEVTDTFFQFTDNQGWGTVYVHAWNDYVDLTTFPGIVMTKTSTNDLGETVFTVYVPDGATGVVLSNGKGDQTVNISDFSQEGYYTKGDRDGDGHLYVTPWGEPVPGGRTVKFTDKHNWGTVYVYAWTSGGGENAKFPGVAMNRDGDAEYGGVNYSAQIPEDSAGIIFSAGENAPKTVDITDLDAEGWYTTDNQSEGNYIAYKWGETPPETPDPPVPPVPTTKTVKFTDKHNWGTVYVYAWTSGGGENAKFPGVAMTRDGDAEYGGVNYSAQIPEDSAGIIFSAGENAAKTVDITDLSAEGWYTTDNQSEGNYIAYKWGETPPEDPTPAGPSFKFTDNRGWGTVYMHAWNDGGALTQWPGDVMSEKTTNDMGETVFTIHVPNGATGVVLSNGNGDQTVNITDFSQEGYYTKGYRDGEGHLYVTSWSEPSGPSAKKILFTCGWGSCFLYSWNDSDGKPSGEWPGTQVTETTTNDMGEKQFVVYVPADAAHIIFNNGSGTQTVNIDNLDVTGYYITGGPDNALTVASW